MMEMRAGDWAVLKSWRYRVVQIDRVTEQCVWVADEPGVRPRRTWREKIICASPNGKRIERAAAQLTSAAAECARREAAARVWLQREQARIVASVDRSQEGEDANAASSRSDESAVGEAETPNPSPRSSRQTGEA